MMIPSRLGCPLSLKTPNMGNTDLYWKLYGHSVVLHTIRRLQMSATGCFLITQPRLIAGTPHLEGQAVRLSV